jgi:hypothetical protein
LISAEAELCNKIKGLTLEVNEIGCSTGAPPGRCREIKFRDLPPVFEKKGRIDEISGFSALLRRFGPESRRFGAENGSIFAIS